MTAQPQPQNRADELKASAAAFLDTITSEEDALMVSEMIQDRFGLMGASFGHRDILGTFQDRIPSLGGDSAATALAGELAQMVRAMPGVKSWITDAMANGGSMEMDERLDEFIYPLVDGDCVPDLVLSTGVDGEALTLNCFETMDELSGFTHTALGKTVAEVAVLAEVADVNCERGGDLEEDAVLMVAHVKLVIGEDQEEFFVKVA